MKKTMTTAAMLKTGAMKVLLTATLFFFAGRLHIASAQSITAGSAASFFLKDDGTVWTCGTNDFGELGDGTNDSYNVPVYNVPVNGLTGIIAISSGGEHSLFLKNDGTVWACGRNNRGQLGDNSNFDSNIPVQVSGLTDITAISAGGEHSLFLKNDGTVWACGRNNFGQLGDGTNGNSEFPVQVSGLTGITAIAAGGFHSLFLAGDATVQACGYNGFGGLGNGTNLNSNTPVAVSGLTGVTAISAGTYHSLFLLNDGSAQACGANTFGGLGKGSAGNSNIPVAVSGLTGITAISAGGYTSLFLLGDSTVRSCGYNIFGQLGNGNNVNSNVPVPVIGFTGITAIACGGFHALYLGHDGMAWACGNNDFGQLGNATNTGSNVPVQVQLCLTGTIPVVAAVNPLMGYPSSSVTITGSGFFATPANNIVYFGATRATVNTANVSQLEVTVPVGATYMPVTVLRQGCALIGYSPQPFLPVFDNSPYIPGIINFDPKTDFTAGTSPYSVAIGDLDGDGKPDLAVANRNSNTVSVFRNISTSGSIDVGSFAAKVDFTTSTNPLSVTIGDLDGDGKPDLAVTNQNSNTVSVFRNTSTSGVIDGSSFAAKEDFTTGSIPYSVAIGDLDGDGKPDMAVANVNSGNVSIFRNTGASGAIDAGSFAAKVDFTADSQPRTVAIGDLNGDGKPDLAVTNGGSNSVSVFRNTSTGGVIDAGSFATKVDFATGIQPISIAIGDLDGDGKPDIAVANISSNSVSVFHNTGTGGTVSFAVKADFTTGIGSNNVAIGDLNGDGKPDLAVTNQNSNSVSVFRNTAISGAITSGSFAAKMDFITGITPSGLAIGDLDGDGKPDIVVANYDGASVSILHNAPLSPIAGPATVCSGENIQLSNAAAYGTWSSGNTAVATVDVDGQVTGGAQGTAVISYTVAGGSTAITVTVNATPAAIAGNAPMCTGSSTITLTNTSANGTWSGGTAGIATVDAATGEVTPGSTQGTAAISYTNGCGSAAVITVTVNAAPAPISGNAPMCTGGSTITLTNTSANGTWSGGTAGIATIDAASGVVTPGGTQGAATISYTNGCGSAAVTTVTVNATPAPIGGNAPMCTGGSTITLTNTSANGTWSGGTAGIATVDAASGVVTPGGTQGTATISYTNGCGVAATITAIVNAVPAPIGGNAQMCVGGTHITLNNISSGGTWSSATPAVATIGALTGIVTPGAVQGTVTISYSNGCGTAASVTATVNATPAPISGNAPLCADGATLTLANTSTNGTWSSSDPAIASVDMMSGVVTAGTIGGTATIMYDNGCGPAAAITFTVNPTPVVQTFTGGGGYCTGTPGVSIGLTLTESGISYQLFSSGIAVSSIIPGTGSAIIFGTTYTAPGYYYAIATNTTTFCTDSFPGVTVHINPLPDTFTVTGGGSYCSSSPTGVIVSLTGSAVGISYQLYDVPGGAPIGAPVAGTGSAISFGLQLAGTYRAVATNTATGCTSDMAGEVTVSLYPSPATFNVTGGGTYCLGGSGVNISLDGSQTGVSYQLIYLGFIPIDTAVAGTGSGVSMGDHFLPGDYTVIATDTTTGCIDTMTGNATLNFSLPPAFYFVGGGGGYCLGDSGVHVTLSGSAAGVRYQIYRSDTAVGAAVNGTGAALDFGWFTTVGTYTVLATDTTTGCTSNMFGAATVSVNPVVMPTVKLNTGLGNGDRVCNGDMVTFTARTTNGGTAPAYEWKINNITVTPPDSTFTYIPTDGDIVWVKMTSNNLCAIPAVAMDTMNVDVDTFAVPSVFIDVNPQTSIAPGTPVTLTAIVTNGGPAPLYQWYKEGIMIPGATNAVYSNNNFLTGDSMTVRVITSGGCGGTNTFNSVIIYVFGTSVANVQATISDVRLIPNPNKGSFAVTGTLSATEDAEVRIEIVNMLGQTIYGGTVTAKKGVINTQIQLRSNLANGMYMLNLQSGTDRKVFHFVLEQ